MININVGQISDYEMQSARSGIIGHRGQGREPGTNRITLDLGEDSKYDRDGKSTSTKFLLDMGDDDFGKIVLNASEGGSTKRKDKKQKKKKKDPGMEFQYNPPPKPQNTTSRRRQNTPLSQFNELLVNIIDSCITYDNTRLFHAPVKKSDVPTYYDVIKEPIDLGTMKSKAKRCEYRTVAAFQNDILLMKTNSEIFNGAHHHVTVQAANIHERCEMLITADMPGLLDLEQKITEEEE